MVNRISNLILVSFIACYLLLICSCSNKPRKTKRTVALQDFKIIDRKLDSFAKKQDAEIFIRAGGAYYSGIRLQNDSIESTSVYWIADSLLKGIALRPYVNIGDTSLSKWTLSMYAMKENNIPGMKDQPFWNSEILENAELGRIEKDFDSLLNIAVNRLNKIRLADLK